MGVHSMKFPRLSLMFIVIICFFFVLPADSVIRIPLTKSSPPPGKMDMSAGASIGVSIEGSPVKTSVKSYSAGRSEDDSLTSSVTMYPISGEFDHHPLRIIKSYYPISADNHLISDVGKICVSVEVICMNKKALNDNTYIIEVIDDNFEIENYSKCGIIKGDTNEATIENLIDYVEGSKKLNCSEFEDIIEDGETFIKKGNNTLYVELKDGLNPKERAVYRYNLIPKKSGLHSTKTIVRVDNESYPDLDNNLEISIQDRNPIFEVDIFINKYEASFGEEIPLRYSIKYKGGSSNPCLIDQVILEPCTKTNHTHETYIYHILGNSTANYIRYVNIPIFDLTNNSTYYINNISIEYEKEQFLGNIRPYHSQYMLPGVYIDNDYYSPNEKIVVSTTGYQYRDIIIAVIGFIITISLAGWEFRDTKKYIKELGGQTGNIKNELSDINRAIKRTTIYRPKEQRPWWWRKPK